MPDGASQLRILEARWPQDRERAETLFREYVESLGVDIGFQNIEAELASLPGRYARPGGAVLIAQDGADAAGIVAYRSFEPGIAEMKRLYVRPRWRGLRLGLGRALAEEAIEDARGHGYRTMLLDTLESMETAKRLYLALGFRPVAPYYDNPLPNVTYMALEL
ncbi:MAG: GNAT family N-acetyltransferase [Pseudorhodoplanes sp.]